jgi:hypothetical protein
MPSAGLCVRFLSYLTLIIYCPENFIIIFIKKNFFRVTEYRFWYSIIGCSSEYPVNWVLVKCTLIILFLAELLNSEHIYLDKEVKHWNSVKCYLFLYKFRNGNEYPVNRVLARTSDSTKWTIACHLNSLNTKKTIIYMSWLGTGTKEWWG